MAKLYYDLITVTPPLRTIEQVPVKWRDEVQVMLDKDLVTE